MSQLKRSLGFPTLLALSISSIIGTGMFFAPAIAAGIAGNISILAWIFLALVSVYVAGCFGELVSIYPKAGGIYEYAKQTYGRFISFILGWIGWLTESIITSLLIVGAITYLLPEGISSITTIIISLCFILLLNLITFIGLEASSIMIISFAIITLAVLSLIILRGLFFINLKNFIPFFTHPPSNIFLAMFFMAETFFGYEAATYLAEETKNPEKVIPKALIYGTIIVGALALLLVFILLGIFNWSNLAKLQSPVFELSKSIFGVFGEYIGG
ncbi:MAG: APC family permease, partial [Nanoarchaeota archaeon]